MIPLSLEECLLEFMTLFDQNRRPNPFWRLAIKGRSNTVSLVDRHLIDQTPVNRIIRTTVNTCDWSPENAPRPMRSPPRPPKVALRPPPLRALKVPPPPGEFHHLLPPADLLHYFGTKNKHEVPEYTITSPKHVTGSRHRRDVNSKKDRLEYHVTAFGKTYELILDHNNDLIAPGCVAEKFFNGTKQIIPCLVANPGTDKSDSDCFYTGYSRSHNQSTVAISTCAGLHGIISIPEDDHDLVIKPVKEHHSSRARRSAGDNPHVVFKRSAQSKACEGVADIEDAILRGAQQKSAGGISVHSAKKRSADELFMELLLVADKTLYHAHGADLHNFLLAITNVAAARFMDPSLGQTLHLSVVKIKILQDDQPDLEIVEEARYGLKSFCEWQERDNPALDSDPLHYDVAVLFTRVDLQHGASGHSTVGLANAGGVCNAGSRCAYVEDTGIDTGLTLAHEIGHTLGLSHDGSQNTCSDSKNVMASAGATGPDSFKWSSCSQASFLNFLRSGRASCLNDVPTHHEELPKDLPGVVYDADDQCRLWIGTKYYNHSDPCGQLWCVDPVNADGIIKSGSAMMDGSMCGQRKYCINAECVDIGANGPQPVDGGWSAWPTHWSECSRTCGGGIRTKVRTCDNPKPRFGGKECEGESIKTNLCNVKACNTSEAKFKELQCQATKDQTVDGHVYDWLPWDQAGAQQCYLLCQTNPGDRIFRRTLEGSKNYKDGTSCVGDQHHDFYRCVKGTCQAHSCDGHSDSMYKFDKCGVCGGSNDTCVVKKGTKTQGEPQKWSTIIQLPRGTTGVQLRNKNRMAKMTLSVNGKPIINEDPSMPSPSQTYSNDGVTFNYRKGETGEDEVIDVVGALGEDVEAQVFTFFADQRFQPDVSYEYNVPVSDVRTYEWRTTNTDCNVQCGGGNYLVEILCHRISDNEAVEDKFCNIFHKPDSLGAPCNPQPCEPEWQASDWGACSKNCGSGSQTRQVNCVQKANGGFTVVAENQCPGDKKPADNRVCNVLACDAHWETSSWSSCSMTCGRGVQSRQVKCVSGQSDVSETNCKETKPETTQACVVTVCDTNIAASDCKDLSSDCGGYGLTLCSEYGDWAKTNCKLTCSFCSASTSVVASVCEDKSKDCTSYGTSVCTGEFADWASENCAKFCGKCISAVESTTSSASTCVDKSTDCAGYGQTVCTGEYAQWASENCAALCGLCSSKEAQTPDASCVDVSPDCSGYGASICQGEYADWAKSNCAKHCGLCTSSAASQPTAQSCTDVSSDCAAYGASICGGDYADWAKANCANYCHLCNTVSDASAAASTCADKIADCVDYGQNVCTNEYAAWAKENCQKMCGFC
nr:A disintegrin and metalloproteinase with thrombospondin motifs 12 [Biomphalaria glabrata]